VTEDDIRKRGLLARFLQTEPQVTPEILLEVKVFEFRQAFDAVVSDDGERLLIGLLNHESFLSRQMGAPAH
jgi:hypothetical protein